MKALGTALVALLTESRGDTVPVGGDEFTELTLDGTQEAVTKFASRVHAALEGLTMLSGTPRVSIGVCTAASGSDKGLAQGTADAALYVAKHGGGSQTVTRMFGQMQQTLTPDTLTKNPRRCAAIVERSSGVN